MLKRLRAAHPILYCILSEVLFLGSMVVFSLLATIGLAAAGADFDTMDGYLLGSVQEAVGWWWRFCCWPAPAGWTCCTGAAAAF